MIPTGVPRPRGYVVSEVRVAAVGDRSELVRGVRAEYLVGALVVGVAVLTRTIRATSDSVIFNDGPRFIDLAEAFLRWDLETIARDDFHPLTSALMAGLGWLGLDLEIAGQALSVAAAGVAAGALWMLARDVLGNKVGLAAGLLFAVHPRIVAASNDVQSDGIHLMFVLVGALSMWRALEGRRVGPAIGAGAACGFAYLTRPEGLIVGVIAAGWLPAYVILRRMSLQRALAMGAAFGCATLLLAGPYFVVLHSVHGDWTITRKKSAMRIVRIDASLEERGAEHGKLNLVGEALGEIGKDGFRAIHPVFLAFALLGFRRGRPQRGTLYLLSYTALLAAILLGLHLYTPTVSRRHWLVAVTLLMPFAGRGMLTLVDRIGQALPRGRVREVFVPASIAVAIGAFAVYSTRSNDDPNQVARKQAAIWLGENAPQASLAGPRRRYGYYAGAADFVLLPPGDDPQLMVDAVREKGVDYVLIDEALLRPGGRDSPVGVEEIYRVPYEGGAVVVLRLEPVAPSAVSAAPISP